MHRIVASVLLCALCSLTTVAAADQPPLKIGVIGLFSGASVLTGQGQEAAIAAFIAQHGDTVAGRKVEIIRRDEQGPQPEISRRLAQELVLQEHVDFLVGGSYSATALAIGDVSTQAKVPFFTTGASASNITLKWPYGARVGFTGAQQAAPLARWALANNIKSVYVMLADNDGGIDAATAFEHVFAAGGGKLAGESRIPMTNNDFSAYMQRAKETSPQAVFAILLNGTGSGPSFVRSFNNSGMPGTGTKLFATMDMVTEHNLPGLADGALGIISPGYYSAAHGGRDNAQFIAAYHAAKGPTDPDMLAVSAYDAINAIYALASAQHGVVDPDRTVQLLKTLRLRSPRGNVFFDPETRDVVQTMYIRRAEKRGDKTMNIEIAAYPRIDASRPEAPGR